MGCACKANVQIGYLQKKYGDNIPQSKATNIRGNVSIFVKKCLTYLILLPVMPFLVIHTLSTSIIKKNKPIDINKTFKIVN